MGIIDYLDYIGVVAFAVSGAVTAIKKRMDYFGILVLAMVTAIGGGVIRDIIIKDGLPTFFLRYEYTLLICATTALVILTKGQLKWAFALDIFDALGLATFTVEAGLTALNMGLNFITFSFVSLITAVGGEGALRRHRLDMGLTPRTRVMVRKRAPMGDPIELHLRGYELTLRLEDARNIAVERA